MKCKVGTPCFQRKRRNRFIVAGLFIVFSTILFINNITQLFDKYQLSYNINIITWIGLIGTIIYTLYKITGGEM